MNDTPSSPKKMSTSRKLLIATIAWVIIANGGMRLYFGPGNLEGAKAIQSLIVGLTTGVIFWGLVIATIVTAVIGRRSDREAAVGRVDPVLVRVEPRPRAVVHGDRVGADDGSSQLTPHTIDLP